jgi:5-formyltetrahydrofolate cyclo-ligase
MEKGERRSLSRAGRAGLSSSARSEASGRIAERVEGLLPDRPRAALAYAALPDEVDVSPLVGRLRASGVRIAYPRACGAGEMTLHWVDDEAALTPGYCGILEPPVGAARAAPDEFDLVLVPGVAFDESCCRLGRGGGFYDRLLPQVGPGALVVGIAFDEQVVGAVPREPHDALVDVVVTPTRVLRRP